jgi:hypothetical protein
MQELLWLLSLLCMKASDFQPERLWLVEYLSFLPGAEPYLR